MHQLVGMGKVGKVGKVGKMGKVGKIGKMGKVKKVFACIGMHPTNTHLLAQVC
jgi:hypothetical protein